MSTKSAASAICAMLAIAATPLASSASTAAGSWMATANLAIPRDNLTATPLEDGRILVVGGVDELSTELYDPPTGAWTPGGALNETHWGHLAVRLADSRVLVAGGARYSSGAELYDPAANTWTPTGSMNVGRISFTGTLLRDGRVLVVGGLSADGTDVQASAEVYDPATGRWTPTASLRTSRLNHTATLLTDGTVLVAGGSNSSGMLRDAELYDPARGRWERVAPMTIPREYATAALLDDGRVLVAAGANPTGILAAELYDPASGTWTRTGAMTDYRGFHAVRLQDGRVLVAGGGYAGDVYSPATGTWTATGPRVYGLHGNAALALLANGQVLSVGGSRLANCNPKGCGSEPVASAELWTLTTAPPTAVSVRAFTGRRSGRSVVLRWRTASEVAAAGFEVYRGAARLNTVPIPAKYSGQARGSTYTFRVRWRSGAYRLRVLRLDGSRAWAGATRVS